MAHILVLAQRSELAVMGKTWAILLVPGGFLMAVMGLVVPNLPSMALLVMFVSALAMLCFGCHLWQTNGPNWR